MIKKDKEKINETTRREVLKYKRHLFKELNDTLQLPLVKSSSFRHSGSHSDMTELDSGTSSRWRQIACQFENLSKYDYKTISSYLEDNPTNNELKCNSAIDFYNSYIKRMEKSAKTEASHSSSLGNKEELKKVPIKEDLLKVFVISFQYISATLVDLAIPCTSEAFSPSGKVRLIEIMQQMQTLNEFLLLILPTKQSQTTLLQYETALVLFIGEKIGEIQEKLSNMAFPLNPSTLADVFYYHFETLAMLTSYNAGKKFMKDAADDGIKYAFEIFERSLITSLSSSLFAEIYSSLIQGAEQWTNSPNTPCLFLSTKYNKKKFQYFHHSGLFDTVQFSLAYINLYYANKIAQVMMDREMFRQEERTIGTIAALMKRNLTTLVDTCFSSGGIKILTENEMLQVEAILNENCICLKFIKHILMVTDNPLGLIEKLSLANTLKSLIHTHLIVSIKTGLVDTKTICDYSIESQDLLANVFATLYKLKRMRVTTSSGAGAIQAAKLTKKSHVHLMILMDEIVMEAVGNSFPYLSPIQNQLGKLRELLVEYFADEKFAVTEKFRELLFKLYTSPIFNYTAPESLELITLQESSKDLINNKAHKTIIRAIAKTIRQDKKILISSVQRLISQVISSKYDSISFGYLKLIYCILTGEAYDDLSFYQILALGQMPLVTDNQTISIKSKDSILSQSSAQEFIESSGLANLLNEVLKLYNVDGRSNVRILEQGISLFLTIQSICEAFIIGQFEIRQLLEVAIVKPRGNKFALETTKLCLNFLKSQPGLETSTYLPDLIARSIHKILINNIEDEQLNELCFPFYDVLNEFLECETMGNSLTQYQNYLFHKNAWQLLVSLLTTHKYRLN